MQVHFPSLLSGVSNSMLSTDFYKLLEPRIRVVAWTVFFLTLGHVFSSSTHAVNPRYGQFPIVSETARFVMFPCDDQSESFRELSVWNLQTGMEVRRIGPFTDRIHAAAISEPTNIVATISGHENRVDAWDLTTGERLWTESAPGREGSRHCQLLFYPDGKHLVTLTAGYLRVRRSREGTERVDLPTKIDAGGMLQMSPDGKRLFFYDRVHDPKRRDRFDLVIRCIDSQNATELGRFRFDWLETDELPAVTTSRRNGLFSVGTDFLVEKCWEPKENRNFLTVWDTDRFLELRQIALEPGNYQFARPYVIDSRGTCTITAANNSGAIFHEYDLRTGEVVGRHQVAGGLIDGGSANIVFAPDTRLLCWNSGLQLSNSSKRNLLLLARYNPQGRCNADITFQAFEGARNSAAVSFDKPTGLSRGTPPSIFLPEAPSRGTYWRFRGGETKLMRKDPAAITSTLRDLHRPLTDRKLSLVDSNKPRLFVFAAGVSKHEFPEYHLRFAAADAKGLAARLQKERGRVFGDVQVTLHTDEDATPAKILEGLDWLQRSCTENDLAVVYFSGHGLRARRGLYYVSYLGDEENIYNTCVNWEDIAKRLTETRASQILFLSDCCHAGSFATDRYVNQQEIAQTVSRAEHLTVFASSSSDEKSFELTRLGHGAFTFALLEALKGEADADFDNRIDWDELVAFVSKRVAELTHNTQHPQVLKPPKTGQAIVVGSRLTLEQALP